MNKLAWVESAPVPQLIIEKLAYFLGFRGTMSNGSVPIKEGSVFFYLYNKKSITLQSSDFEAAAAHLYVESYVTHPSPTKHLCALMMVLW